MVIHCTLIVANISIKNGLWLENGLIRTSSKLSRRVQNILITWDLVLLLHKIFYHFGSGSEMMNKYNKIKQIFELTWKLWNRVGAKWLYKSVFTKEIRSVEFSKIVDNHGLCSLAKLLLNSFWAIRSKGKPAENSHCESTCKVLYNDIWSINKYKYH